MKAHWPPVAVFVDLDNTLHDYDAAARAARTELAAQLAAQAGVSVDDALSAYIGVIEQERVARDKTGSQMRMRRLRQVAEVLAVELNIDALVEELGRALLDSVAPFAGAAEALEQLSHSYKILILTEGHADIQVAIADTLGLSGFPLFATWSHNVSKRDGSAFELAMQTLDLSPDQVVMIGDDWDCDVVAAAEAGLWQLWISHERPTPSRVPDRFLSAAARFSQAPALLATGVTLRPG